jgi:hypothetical protein
MRLTLRKDTLADLTPDELLSVVGGVTTTGYYPTIPIQGCNLTTSYPG